MQPSPHRYLPHLGVLRFAGADAQSFLQGQLSNDTRRLAGGEPLLAAYSTPQGRVVAILRLLPHSSGILAILPQDIVLPTLERLRKFVLRAKVQLQDVSDQFAVAGGYRDAAPGGSPGYVEEDGVGMAPVARTAHPMPDAPVPDAPSPDGPSPDAPSDAVPAAASAGPVLRERFWLVGPRDALARREVQEVAGTGAQAGTTPNSPDFDAEWRLADIRAGLPQIYAATREMFVAQMLNLDLLDGISFTKGCFTGQEIIARTQHLGRIKRRLYRLGLPAGSYAPGQSVHLQDGRTGRLTDVVATADGCEALAVLSAPDAAHAALDAAHEAAHEAAHAAARDAAPDAAHAGHDAHRDAGHNAGEAVAAPGTSAPLAALALSLPYALTQAS